MNTIKFDPTKPVQTRDGRKSRIVYKKLSGLYPILAIITNPDGSEWSQTCTSDGLIMLGCNSINDLINIPDEPTYRPWTADEVPMPCVVRDKKKPETGIS